MSAVIPLLEFIANFIGVFTNSSQIASLIATLEQVVKTVGDEISTVGPSVKNIIAALASSDAITADQLDSLQALDASIDAAFDAASGV
jgi:hypothetical protein